MNSEADTNIIELDLFADLEREEAEAEMRAAVQGQEEGTLFAEESQTTEVENPAKAESPEPTTEEQAHPQEPLEQQVAIMSPEPDLEPEPTSEPEPEPEPKPASAPQPKPRAKREKKATVRSKYLKEKKTKASRESGSRNLQFLEDFFTQTGLQKKAAAEKAGFTRQAIFYWFQKDDVSLESICKLLGANGYEISFDLRRKPKRSGVAVVSMNSAEEEPMPRQSADGERRLGFLESAFSRFGIGRKEAASRLGVGYVTMYYWFKKDDLYLSYLFSFAKEYDLDLIISINKA